MATVKPVTIVHLAVVAVVLLYLTSLAIRKRVNTPYVSREFVVSSNKEMDEPTDTQVEVEHRPSTEVEHWIPDWYNQTDIGAMLRKRVQSVKERCKSYAGYRNHWSSTPRGRYVKSNNLRHCVVAKAGSTFWEYLVKAIRVQETKHRPNAKIRTTTSRNPWHRLVSTYIQKMELSNHTDDHVRRMCTQNLVQPTFGEFVKHCVISNWKRNVFNIHWLPAVERCNICKEDFDYIVAVENMATEAYYVLNKAGVKDYKTLYDEARNSTIRMVEKQGVSTNYQEYYKQLDREDIESLRLIYNFEIYVFKYPNTPFVDFTKS